jgi:hypothetical protein
MIDLNDMRGRARYCAERAETSVHHDMREHWLHAADVWLYAAGAIQKASRIIDEWDRTKSSEASLTSPRVGKPRH